MSLPNRKLMAHSGKRPQGIGSLLLIATLGLAVPATALESGPLVQGSYEIETWFTDSVGLVWNKGCMVMMGGSPASYVPALYRWPWGGNHCGLGSPDAQTTWDIYPVISGEKVRHVIKSRTNGRCLLRAESGQAARPSLFLWPDVSDSRYCGLPSAAVFIANGQAAWDLTGFQVKVNEANEVVYSGRLHLDSGALHFQSVHLDPPGINYSPAEFLHNAITDRWHMDLWSTLAKSIPRKAL